MIDPVALASRLVAFDTVNPPGRELECARYLADALKEERFDTRLVPMGEGRASLVARRGRQRAGKPLVFTGHIDVVPLGTRPWASDPFSGKVADGKLHGRGSSDMKAGVAAFVAAACAEAASVEGDQEVVMLITAGEETGCEGASSIVAAGLQGAAGALVVCEPTANAVYVGHKGALWLKAVATGKTAHGSMPEQGDNAVYRAARAVGRLECFDFGCPRHPVLGAPTLNVGSFHGGLNINSVPDRAEIQIDLRTIPAVEHAQLQRRIREQMAEDLGLETLIDLPGIWTPPEDPWVRRVLGIVARATGEVAKVGTATYFTDASVLVPALDGVPTLVLGPGEPTLAHQTDEWCSVERIHQAVAIYRGMIRDWAEAEPSARAPAARAG
ncbi:MAG TPA: M20 family metallopeptidase [Usitatibacter sp.]|nr:M20 family metallopeptidase [Usitatibacter sp.]